MNRDGIPLPSALSGVTVERLIRIDEALLFLITGALAELADDWWLEQTGALTQDDAKLALSDMLWCFMGACDVTPIGTVSMFADATPPARWLPCDGRAVGRVDYAALFAVIGTHYGAGNGTTTFNLPNLTDRLPMGAGGAVVPNAGNTGGALTHTLTIAEMPSHDHNFAQTAHTHLLTDPGHTHGQQIGAVDAFLATGGTGRTGYGAVTTSNTTPVNTKQAGAAITVQTANANITHNAQGSGNAHSVLNPVIGLFYNIYSGV